MFSETAGVVAYYTHRMQRRRRVLQKLAREGKEKVAIFRQTVISHRGDCGCSRG